MSRARDLADGTFQEINIPFSGADDVNSIRIEGSNGSSERYALDIVADGANTRTDFKIGSGGGTPATKMSILSGGGISFNGDTAAANALDDYEEGDIDISTMYFETSGSATAHSANTTLRYVKIGNQVTITGNLFFSSVTSQNGPLKIPLPFSTSASGQKLRTIGVIGNYQSNTPTIVKIENNASYGLMLYPNGWSSVPISAQQTYVLNVTYLAA